MRRYALTAICSTALSLPLVVVGGTKAQASGAAPPMTTQVAVWNRTGRPIQLEVRAGDDPILSSRVNNGAVATSVDAARIVQREPGLHTFYVIDHSRTLSDSITLEFAPKGQNLGVHLTPEGIALVVTRSDILSLTPAETSHRN
jgi:hypothetical protein